MIKLNINAKTFYRNGYETQNATREENLIRRRQQASRHGNQLWDAIQKHCPDRGREKKEALKLLRPSEAKHLDYMHPGAATKWLLRLEDAFYDVVENPEDAGTVTAVHAPWNTNVKECSIDVDGIRRRIWQGLRGFNYIGLIEFAVFDNVREGNGKLLAPHFQGILWNVEITKDDASRAYRTFDGGMDGTHGLWVEKLTNFFGALSYAVKLPAYGYRRIQCRDGSFAHDTCKLYLSTHYRLFEHLRHLSLPQLTVAGGEGAAVLRAAKKAAGWKPQK
ncbi:MAG: hypothetical protein KAH11_08305 [Rhodospirillales bacterium]|nr:hypothetical protein [Rhodospirillales bacterium]